jgi:hypothetical protein
MQEDIQTHSPQLPPPLAVSDLDRNLSENSDDVFETSRGTADDLHMLSNPAPLDDTITSRAVNSVVHDIAVDSTPERIKSCLHMMIKDMENASLSKVEMTELEDMFEEAKCLLFAARLRGRKSGL